MTSPRMLLAFAVAAQVAVSITQFGLPAISADVREEFGLGPAGFGAVFAAIGLGSAAALIPAGMAVDRFGGRRVLVAGALLNFTGYAAAASATDARWFGAAVFLAGFGSAAVPVAGMSTLLRTFPPNRRGIALGWRQLAVPLGGAVGAVLLPLLAGTGGVRLAMLASGTITAVTALWFARLLPDSGGETTRFSLDGVLTAPGMPTLLALGMLYVFTLGATLTYLVSAGHDAGLGTREAGALFVLLNIAAAAARLVWGRVADRDGGTRRLRTLADTGLLAAAGCIALPFALDAGLVAAMLATVVAGFGIFGFNGVLYVAAGEVAGPERAARAVGVASTIVFGVGSLAAPIAGLIVESGGYDAMWAVAATSAVVGAAVARRATLRRPPAAPAHSYS